ARDTAYVALADLCADDPRRWERRDEIVALLHAGLAKVAGEPAGAINLTLALASFERSVGRTEAARARLLSLDDARLSPEQRKKVLDLADAIRTEEQARALVDQPEPPGITADLEEMLARAEERLAHGEAAAALGVADRLTARLPSW